MSNAPTLASRTLNIPAFRFEQLTAALAKLGKKAVKLGCKAPAASILRSYTVDVSEDKKFPELVEWNEVKIDYELITVAGEWRFLASLETVDSVNGEPRNRVSGPNLSNEHAARFVTAHQNCDHCNHNRKRNLTFIVQNCNDETKQIGSTCLQAYMGIDPAAAVAGMSFDAKIAELGDGDDWGYSKSAPRCWSLNDVAAIALSLISKNGFVSAAQAEFQGNKTGDDMVSFLVRNVPQLSDWYAAVTPSEENKAAAAAIVKRLSDRILPAYINAPTTLDSFAFKLGIILNRQVADYKDMQIFAAAVNREAGIMARENVKSSVKNEWLPNVKEGDKIAVEATISMAKEVQSSFGCSTLVKFLTAEGYPLTTFHSGQQEFNPGSRVKVTGTVKRLEDGKFGKQTMLTRVKVVAVG
jgi:hypothetical protein